MTEAEKLAAELEAPVEVYIEPTLLEEKAAALLRSQAQEIERLRGHIKHIGNDALRTELHQKTEQIDAMKLTINNMSGILDDQSEAIIGKDALLREVLAVMFSGSTRAQKLAVVTAIKTELGENNAD